jgi:polar amino acid transport system substrate-binding protein
VALVARMTPPLLQIYVLLFGIGSLAAARWGIQFNAFSAVVVSLSLYTGAGVMRVLEDAARHERKLSPRFQLDLSTLGLLIRRASAPITALLVNVTKATMMASAVAVPELLSVSTSIIAEHGNVATMMNTIMVFFVVLVFGVLRLLRYAERRWCDGG